MTRLAVVLGSVRPNRMGGAIAQWVADQAAAFEGVEVEIVDIDAFSLPLFAEPMAPMMAAPADPAGAAFNEKIQSFDAVIFVAPEYNYSIPGSLKNAIDFLEPKALANKGVGLVGYSYSNGIRAVEHLKQIVTGFGGAVASPQVYLSLNTDVADGAFAPAAYHDGEVPAMVQAVLARSQGLASLR
ncbi:NADPH-dependent FMN reductase [Actinomyces slackii]|uniref:FMN-dependent NADPH-azoreductase n=1 Tax=Actinomyces slackii TaxID=52774 RepID=A0A3S4SDE7_9ACTO|nr:NAD(P)H-dependent oxidoreductase [Actinomyces slackii]VEG73492.1 FMN-dependent NADPH-azoreductase [Actinomyces slackii]